MEIFITILVVLFMLFGGPSRRTKNRFRWPPTPPKT
jgi:hypothetical protein